MIPKTQQGMEPGKTAMHHPAEYIRSKVAEAELGFGMALTDGTDNGEVTLPDAGTDDFIGVSAYSTSASKLEEEKYSVNDPVGLLETGVIAVQVTEDVAEGNDVRYIISGDNKGKFCKTATANTTVKITKGAEWSGSKVGETAPLYLKGLFETDDD